MGADKGAFYPRHPRTEWNQMAFRRKPAGPRRRKGIAEDGEWASSTGGRWQIRGSKSSQQKEKCRNSDTKSTRGILPANHTNNANGSRTIRVICVICWHPHSFVSFSVFRGPSIAGCRLAANPIAEDNSAGSFNVSKEALWCEVMRLILRL